MATPEQKIYGQFVTWCANHLSRGRYKIQRIETSTGTGIPDIYFIYKGKSIWFESKTLNYKVSKEQVNWAWTTKLAGGECYVLTEGLVVCEFDDRMIEFSSLRAYINKCQPNVYSLKDVLEI